MWLLVKSWWSFTWFWLILTWFWWALIWFWMCAFKRLWTYEIYDYGYAHLYDAQCAHEYDAKCAHFYDSECAAELCECPVLRGFHDFPRGVLGAPEICECPRFPRHYDFQNIRVFSSSRMCCFFIFFQNSSLPLIFWVCRFFEYHDFLEFPGATVSFSRNPLFTWFALFF